MTRRGAGRLRRVSARHAMIHADPIDVRSMHSFKVRFASLRMSLKQIGKVEQFAGNGGKWRFVSHREKQEFNEIQQANT
jgi:hypothetical protein